ncbi:MAG: hypothetical protein GEV07_27125 [Streptosporangiales bacterium]|nr:hypothetical protein [Streptosporangiales bacterium]
MTTALAELRRRDPDLATAAELAWQRVDGSDDAGLVSQWRVQAFCWLDLPGDRSVDSPARVVDGLAALLDLMSLRRYADIARGEETRDVLAGAARSDAGLRHEVRGALTRSGIQPPDTELLSWAPQCGPSEATAYVLVADALEIAVQVGEYTPKRAGWLQRREEITNRVLATGRPELDGRAPYEGIVAERVLAWARSGGSLTGQRLLARLEPQMAQAVPAAEPAAAERLLRRLQRFLAFVEGGVPLTDSGYLKPDAVARCVDEVGLADDLVASPARERDVPPVYYLRTVAQRLGLVRTQAKRLVLAPAGRDALGKVTRLWRQVAGALVPVPGRRASSGAHAAVAVWDILLAALLDDEPCTFDDIVDVCLQVLDESGWRLANGQPVDHHTVGGLLSEAYRDVHWLGLLQRRDPYDDAVGLVPVPDADQLFLAALRHRLLHSRTLFTGAG